MDYERDLCHSALFAWRTYQGCMLNAHHSWVCEGQGTARGVEGATDLELPNID